MSVIELIADLRTLEANPEWKIIVDASNLEIASYEKSLDAEPKKVAPITSHTLARRIIKKMNELLLNIEKRLAGVPGKELVCERVAEAISTWKNGLYYNEGLDFKAKYSEHDFERKYRHILWCLTVMPETLITNLEKELPVEQIATEEEEALEE